MSRGGSGGVLPCSVLVLGMEGAGKSQLIRHIRRECGRRLLVSEDLRGLLTVSCKWSQWLWRMAVACRRFKPGRGAPNLRAAANSAHRTLHRARVWAPEGQLAHCCISAAASPLLPRGRRSACRVVQIGVDSDMVNIARPKGAKGAFEIREIGGLMVQLWPRYFDECDMLIVRRSSPLSPRAHSPRAWARLAAKALETAPGTARFSSACPATHTCGARAHTRTCSILPLHRTPWPRGAPRVAVRDRRGRVESHPGCVRGTVPHARRRTARGRARHALP